MVSQEIKEIQVTEGRIKNTLKPSTSMVLTVSLSTLLTDTESLVGPELTV